jgi:hypothetical protein
MRCVVAVVALAAAVGFVGLTGCSGSLHVDTDGPTAPGIQGALPLATTASAPLKGRTQAELSIVSGFSTISVSAGPIGDRLFELSGTPGDVLPAAALTGDTVAITNGHALSNHPTSDSVRIVLNPNVRWRVALSGGATSAVVDLSAAHLAAVDVTQGISSFEVTLPAQAGTTQLALAAGVSSLRVHTRGAEPARATLSAGAGSAVIDGETHTGVAAGSIFAGPGWDAAANRVDIECSAGIGALVVDQV